MATTSPLLFSAPAAWPPCWSSPWLSTRKPLGSAALQQAPADSCLPGLCVCRFLLHLQPAPRKGAVRGLLRCPQRCAASFPPLLSISHSSALSWQRGSLPAHCTASGHLALPCLAGSLLTWPHRIFLISFLPSL